MLFKIPMNCVLYVNFCDAKTQHHASECKWPFEYFVSLVLPSLLLPRLGSEAA